MSRVFDGSNAQDREDLMAIIRIWPDIEIQFNYNSHLQNSSAFWVSRSSNYESNILGGGLRELDEDAAYRIKED